jgi:hypothetical protein
LDLLARLGKPKTDQGVLQFLYTDGSRAVSVQGPEALLELLYLVVVEREDMPLAMLDQPLPLLLVMQVFDLHLVPLLPLGTRDHLPVPALDDLLLLITVVFLLIHHFMSAVPPRYS